MGALSEGWRRLLSVLRRQELEDGLDDEIRFHVEQQADKNRRAGMSADEARRQALLTFGGVQRVREQTRDEFRAARLEDLARDVRFGWRALRRAPGFLTVAVVTLALGVGATTAMFSVVYGILLRPLPYPDQDRLVEIVHEVPALGIGQWYASPAIYFGYRDHNRTFDAIGHWDWDSSPVTVSGNGEPESVTSLEMTHEVLAILGAKPILGRSFTDADDRPGAAPTVMISVRLRAAAIRWRQSRRAHHHGRRRGARDHRRAAAVVPVLRIRRERLLSAAARARRRTVSFRRWPGDCAPQAGRDARRRPTPTSRA